MEAKRRKEKYFKLLLLIYILIVISIVTLAEQQLLIDNIIRKDKGIGTGDSDLEVMHYPENIVCSYRYCPFKLDFKTPNYKCIKLQDIKFVTVKGNLDYNFNIDNTWRYDGTIFECKGTLINDIEFNITYLVYPDRHINLTNWFPDTIPLIYNLTKDYCYNTTRIYSQDYLDYNNNKICINNSKSLNGYFIAEAGTSGKFDVLISSIFNSISKLFFIDPYWNATNTTFNGTHNYTQLNNSGFIEINDSVELPNSEGIDLNRNMTGNILLLHNNNTDMSGSFNNATYVGTANWTGTFKLGNASLFLDGNSDCIQTPDVPELDFDVNDFFSVSAWIYLDTLDGSHQNIISKRLTTDEGWLFYVEPNTDILVFIMEGTNAAASYSKGTKVLQTGTWYHVVGVHRKDSNIDLYIDGVEDKVSSSSSSATGDYFNNQPAYIGCHQGSSRWLDGNIDEVAVFNRSLSTSEVRNLYSAQKGSYEQTSETVDNSTWNNITYFLGSPYNLAELPDNTGIDSGDYINFFNMTGSQGLFHLNGDVTDSSGQGNNGTNNGVDFVAGKFGSNAGDFVVGNIDYININNIEVDLALTTTGTWCMWIKPDDVTPATATLLIGFGDTNANTRLIYYINPTGYLVTISDRAGGKFNVRTTNALLTQGDWEHTCLRHNGVRPDIFLNGELIAMTDVTTTDLTYWFSDYGTTLDTGRIGSYNWDNNGEASTYDGLMDEVAIWNRSLSTSEIEQLFLRGLNLTLYAKTTGSWETVGNSPYNFTTLVNHTNITFQANYSRESSTTLFSPELHNVSFGYTILGSTNTVPNVTLVTPINNTITNNNVFTFNYTDVEETNASCSLIINGTSLGTNSSTVNATDTSITANSTISQGTQDWYVSCNDGTDTGNSTNNTFTYDNISPNIIITQPTGTQTSFTINSTFTITDTNINSCSYWVKEGTNTIVLNTSINCNNISQLFTTTYNDKDYRFYLYANDTAGNSNSSYSNFEVNVGGSEGSGRGGGLIPPIISITPEQAELLEQQPELLQKKTFIDHAREIAENKLNITGLTDAQISIALIIISAMLFSFLISRLVKK